MKGIFRMQSRSEIRKRKQEKQRIILGIIILILAILITIITASIISKNTAKEVATKEPESLADEFVNSVNTQNFEEDVNEEIIENSSLLCGPQTDFKKIWQDKLSALADKAWNDYHTQVTE